MGRINLRISSQRNRRRLRGRVESESDPTRRRASGRDRRRCRERAASVRSAALCESIHEVPPPTLAGTVRDVLAHISTTQLRSFVGRAIADDPGLAPTVFDSLMVRIGASPDDPAVLSAALGGLRLADFTLTARRWAAIPEQHDVPMPLRALALDLAMIDSELVDGFDPRLIAAIEEIRLDRASSGYPLRDQLVAQIGVDVLTTSFIALPA